MMPIPLLAMMISPKRPFLNDPVVITSAKRTPSMALMRVNTLARMISPTVRPVFSPATFTCPAETRWATCAAVSPRAGSTGSVRSGVSTVTSTPSTSQVRPWRYRCDG